jgi:hypothetical protein
VDLSDFKMSLVISQGKGKQNGPPRGFEEAVFSSEHINELSKYICPSPNSVILFLFWRPKLIRYLPSLEDMDSYKLVQGQRISLP